MDQLILGTPPASSLLIPGFTDLLPMIIAVALLVLAITVGVAYLIRRRRTTNASQPSPTADSKPTSLQQ